jgi:hypothetical protein
MGLLARIFGHRQPGTRLILTQLIGTVGGTILLTLAFGTAKSYPPNAMLLKQIMRNYGADAVIITPVACMSLLLMQAVGRFIRRAREVLWNRALLWIVPTIGLLIGFKGEWDQFSARPSQGDWFDLLAETLGWAVAVVALLWADHADRRPRRIRRLRHLRAAPLT